MTDQELIDKIEEILDQLRPNIQMDGGDIRFVRFQDGVVYVRLLGACVDCPISSYTIKQGIEESLKDQLSEVREVIAVENDDL
jgi:Fe-S cluster biogenesis protein NfuA